MPFYQYDKERLAAHAIVQRVIDQTGIKVPVHVREMVEHAVTNDLILEAIARHAK